MASDKHKIISQSELNIIVKDIIKQEKMTKCESLKVQTPGYQELTKALEDIITRAVIRLIHENKDPEPRVDNILRNATHTIMQTAWNCIEQDYALMTRRIYKTLDEEGYWDCKEE